MSTISTAAVDAVDRPGALPRVRRGAYLAAGLTFMGFAAVISAIEALAVRGQLDFAQHVLTLNGGYVYAVPVALEGGTLASAALALWATLRGRRSFGHRAWTGLFLASAAGANYLGALAAGRSTVAAVYLALACVAALHLWHAILKEFRADSLPASTPPARIARFRPLRWVPGIAFRETSRAWRYSIREGISDSAACLAAVRGEVRPPATDPETGEDLRGLPRAEAWQRAFAATGGYDVAPALAWLTEQGVKTDRSYGYEVRKRLTSQRRAELHTVNGSKKAVAS